MSATLQRTRHPSSVMTVVEVVGEAPIPRSDPKPWAGRKIAMWNRSKADFILKGNTLYRGADGQVISTTQGRAVLKRFTASARRRGKSIKVEVR